MIKLPGESNPHSTGTRRAVAVTPLSLGVTLVFPSSLPLCGEGNPWHDCLPCQVPRKGFVQTNWPGRERSIQAEASGSKAGSPCLSASSLSCSRSLSFQVSCITPLLRLLLAQPLSLRRYQTTSQKCPGHLGNPVPGGERFLLPLSTHGHFLGHI